MIISQHSQQSLDVKGSWQLVKRTDRGTGQGEREKTEKIWGKEMYAEGAVLLSDWFRAAWASPWGSWLGHRLPGQALGSDSSGLELTLLVPAPHPENHRPGLRGIWGAGDKGIWALMGLWRLGRPMDVEMEGAGSLGPQTLEWVRVTWGWRGRV